MFSVSSHFSRFSFYLNQLISLTNPLDCLHCSLLQFRTPTSSYHAMYLSLYMFVGYLSISTPTFIGMSYNRQHPYILCVPSSQMSQLSLIFFSCPKYFLITYKDLGTNQLLNTMYFITATLIQHIILGFMLDNYPERLSL